MGSSTWFLAQGNPNIKVGIYDSGIDNSHPDFNAAPDLPLTNRTVIAGGFDYTQTSPSPAQPHLPVDDNGHGTVCAGIIGARSNNSEGVAGIAGGNYSLSPPSRGVSLYDMKIFTFSRALPGPGVPVPSTDIGMIANAIYEGGARTLSGSGYGLHVMNHSWGEQNVSINNMRLLRESMFTAFQNKVVFAAANGNILSNSPIVNPFYPAGMNDEWVLTVGSNGPDGNYKTGLNGVGPCDRDDYVSNHANNVDLIAPGSIANVYTTHARSISINNPCGPLPTTNPGYAASNGTSVAAPHAAGVAALLLQTQAYRGGGTRENFSPEDVENIMELTTTGTDGICVPATGQAPLPFFAYNRDYQHTYDTDPNRGAGWGRLNAGRALYAVIGQYRLVHDVSTPTTQVSNQPLPSTTVTVTGSYTDRCLGGDYLGPQFPLSATPNKVTLTFQPQTARLIRSDEIIVGAWVRNSSSKLWGAKYTTVVPGPGGSASLAGPFVDPYPGAKVVRLLNSDHIEVEGYQYTDNASGITSPCETQVEITYYVFDPQGQEVPLPYYPKTPSSADSLKALEAGEVWIFPNPGSSFVSLACTLPKGSQNATVEFIDSFTGKAVRTFTFHDLEPGPQRLSLDVRELANKFYTYRLTTDNQVKTGRFVKE